MTMELPLNKSREGLGAAIGSNLAGGATAFNDTRAIDQILSQVSESGNPQDMTNAMQSILAKVSPGQQQQAMQVLQNRQQAMILNKQQQAMQQQGLNPYLPMDLQKIKVASDAKERALLEKNKTADELMRNKAKTKFEYENKGIQTYVDGLQTRESIATNIRPSLTEAKKYRNNPARFIPGTKAYKSLDSLATRAFGFYKPLFGGRLTQSEFLNGLKSLSANKALPGGFDQAVNLIESMAQQADMEGNLFNDFISKGLSPFEAKHQTKLQMQSQADNFAEILETGKVPSSMQNTQQQPQQNQMQQGQQVNTLPTNPRPGDLYQLPNGQVVAFRNNQWVPR